MWDVLKLAIQSPSDYIGAFKKRELTFTEMIDEGNDIYTFVFKPTKPLHWKTGQHAVFSFPDKKISGRTWRPFSIAASPHEAVVKIGTVCVAEPSDFKAKLRELKPGDRFTMHGPFGEFYITPKDTTLVGVAGGIGITPFRALLHDIAHGHSDASMELIYSAKPGAHTHKADFDRYVEMTDKIKVHYVTERGELSEKLEALIQAHGNNASYYISGAPRMIDGIRTTLLEHNIKRIVNDPFKGY